jgi:phthiocerol/phenolphthiocerol synthesis type-I polyketide synthase E
MQMIKEKRSGQRPMYWKRRSRPSANDAESLIIPVKKVSAMKANKNYTGLEIAIIGIGCHFPDAPNWRDFWRNLTNGLESVEVLSDSQLVDLGNKVEYINNKDFVRTRVSLKDKDLFDFSFFKYSSSEALLLNPLHRILHECAWEALEDAGYDPDQTKGPIGVFAGGGDDLNWKVYSELENLREIVDMHTLQILNDKDFLVSLLSYKLNLKGPSISVNTACSTSLVAVNLACKSLLFGESNMALAGGACVFTSTKNGYFYQEGITQSSDGHCRAFDKDASGIVEGEGAGIVVLKRLADAIADGDHIYAVIKGSAINNDGSIKVGFTAPSVEGQVDCIRKAQAFAQVDSDSITYVEAHGTGTRLGDPIEMEALNIAFNRNSSHRCAIGSVKTNIGHLDTAAGVAGLIKAALSLKYKKIPPSLNFKEPNPEIDFSGGPFYVNVELKEWEGTSDRPLRAAVSSLGIGGTNAHVILEEAPIGDRTKSIYKYNLIPLSAGTPESLRNYMDSLKTFLEKEENIDISDLAYTLQVGRRSFLYRQALVCETKAELIGLLDEAIRQPKPVRNRDRQNAVVFMFPGQGSQYAGMARELYLSEPIFRKKMDRGFSLIDELTGEDLSLILFSGTGGDNRINETRYTQPLLFLTEYAMACLLMSLGIEPDYMIGHSIGEYVAACISGVFNFEDALKIVLKRAKLMNSLDGGDMLSLLVPEADAEPLLSDNIHLAAVNGPESIVLSGDKDSIGKLKKRLDSSGNSYITLHTSHAFHSGMITPIMNEFGIELSRLTFHKPRIPFVSNLTGNLIEAQQICTADYWVRQMRETVQFYKGINTLYEQGSEPVFLECGPGHSLTSLLRHQRSSANPPISFNLIRSVKETENDVKFFTRKIGEMWSHGVTIDWGIYHSREKRYRISLPTYCFDKISLPVEVRPSKHEIFKLVKPDEHTRGIDGYIYSSAWKRKALKAGNERNGTKRFLFFTHSKEIVDLIKPELLEEKDELIEVYAGNGFEEISKRLFVVDPYRSDHFICLANALASDGVKLTDIVYSWPICVGSETEMTIDNRAIGLAYFSVIKIIQAILNTHSLDNIKITFITNSLQKVIGTETGPCLQSLILGLATVLPQEYPVSCSHIDLDAAEPSVTLANQLAKEIRSATTEWERHVAFRCGCRWVKDFQRIRLSAYHYSGRITKGGVYLITGGLGKLGSLIARYLIENYSARVVLTGRRKTGKFGPVEGAVYHSADVADLAAFSRVIEEIESSMGRIHGVIHTAGIIDAGYFELIEDNTPEKAIAMFAPKVKGIENIYALFSCRNPDFVWISSSVSGVLGGLGFSAYASANLFMDHFVYAIADSHPNWKSVCLAEMLLSDEDGSRSDVALTRGEITDLFEWSLIMDVPVIVESKHDLFERMRDGFSAGKGRGRKEEEHADLGIKRERPNLTTSYTEPATDTEMRLSAIYGSFLGIDNIGSDDIFFELGGDSLKGMMLVRRIKKEFDINITVVDFLKRPTIRQMAVFIDEIKLLSKESKRSSKIVI